MRLKKTSNYLTQNKQYNTQAHRAPAHACRYSAHTHTQIQNTISRKRTHPPTHKRQTKHLSHTYTQTHNTHTLTHIRSQLYIPSYTNTLRQQHTFKPSHKPTPHTQAHKQTPTTRIHVQTHQRSNRFLLQLFYVCACVGVCVCVRVRECVNVCISVMDVGVCVFL